MPATAVSYTPRPYVRSQEPYGLPYAPRGNTLAQLLRLGGNDAARFASRGGDISAQMWQNLAGQISNAGQSLSQYYAERPQREAQARYDALRIENLEGQVDDRAEARGERQTLQKAYSDALAPDANGVLTWNPDRGAQVLVESGREDLVPAFRQQMTEWDAAALQLERAEDQNTTAREQAKEASIRSAVRVAQMFGGTPEAAAGAVEKLIANKVLTRAEGEQFLDLLEQDPTGVRERLNALIGEAPQRPQNPTEASLAERAALGDPVAQRAFDMLAAPSAQNPAAVGSFEDYVTQKYGPRPTAENIEEARQSYGDANRSQITIPTYDAGADEPLDPKSQDLMSHAGLSYNGFLAITGRMSQLPRDRETRNRASAEVSSWARERGMDVSTFASQYRAYNEALENNIQRYNRTLLAEGEIEASVANLKGAAARSGFGDTRAINAARQWAQGELNDPTAAEYAFFLNQLTNDIALYNAASQGRGALQSDLEEAKSVVRRGIATGSLTGMQSAITQSVKKMGTVLEGAVNRSRRNVWELFGVGDRYRSTTEDATVVPPEVSRALESFGPGRHTLSDGSVWVKLPDGTIQPGS
jgi:hypothetical protein